MKCLIITDAQCKHEDSQSYSYLICTVQAIPLLVHIVINYCSRISVVLRIMKEQLWSVRALIFSADVKCRR